MSELSDDHGPRLRFTGTFVGVSAVDLVSGAFTADFTHFALRCAARAPYVRGQG